MILILYLANLTAINPSIHKPKTKNIVYIRLLGLIAAGISLKMSGLVKAKKYAWKDTNLALFGSDTEKQVKKSSAQTEPAWKNAGEKPGLQIWRIVKFKVTSWPEEDYGKFYNGDSYIILNTYKEEESDALSHDVHFWIGAYSSQDEYGTAAYKTVELDTFLDDLPVQHREVQDHESDLFKSYFSSITQLEGGSDTGFRKVNPETYKPRLLHFHGDRNQVLVKEILRCRDLVDSGDVYILDLGLQIYLWIGKDANKDERYKAIAYLQALKSERGGKPKADVVDEADISDTHGFYKSLDQSLEDADTDCIPIETDVPTQKKLYRLSDATGSMEFTLEQSDEIDISHFDSNDVFILDATDELFVWIGKLTSEHEYRNALSYAQIYLRTTTYPWKPVSCLKEGVKNKYFEQAIGA
ncbi:hypothetical protein ScPMuIL_007488 [Solemya velum]